MLDFVAHALAPDSNTGLIVGIPPKDQLIMVFTPDGK